MHKLPLEDDCADAFTAFDSLEHLLPDEVDSALDQIARNLKPTGTFIASISYRPSRIKVHGEDLHPTVTIYTLLEAVWMLLSRYLIKPI